MTKHELLALVESTFPSNDQKQITAANHREFLKSLIGYLLVPEDVELLTNKKALSSTAGPDEYATSQSVWSALQDVMAIIPAGGLKVPISVELESQLPDVATLAVGDYFYVQNMDQSMPQRTGRAWVNYTDQHDTSSPLKYWKVYDQYQTMDGVSIKQTGSGTWGVDPNWVRQQVPTIQGGRPQDIQIPIQPFADHPNLFLKIANGILYLWGKMHFYNPPTTLDLSSGQVSTLYDIVLEFLSSEAQKGGSLPETIPVTPQYINGYVTTTMYSYRDMHLYFFNSGQSENAGVNLCIPFDSPYI